MFRSTNLSKLAVAVLGLAPALVERPALAADPTTADCLSANEHAISLRAQHKLRDARSQLLVCAAATCPADVRNECTRRVEDVNKSMPTLVFEAKDAAGNDLSGVRVTMDEQPLVERLEGTALSIDPGEHQFAFETQGYPKVWKQLVIREGEKERRERVVFGETPAGLEAPTTGGVGASSPQRNDTSSPTRNPGALQRTVGWSATGAGAVGIVLGVVFTVQKNSKNDEADRICPSGMGCNDGDNAKIGSLTDQANTKGTLAAISFVTGGLLVAGGLVAVFTAPDKSKTIAIAPALSPGFHGLIVAGEIW